MFTAGFKISCIDSLKEKEITSLTFKKCFVLVFFSMDKIFINYHFIYVNVLNLYFALNLKRLFSCPCHQHDAGSIKF